MDGKRELWDIWKVEVLSREQIIAKCGTRAEDTNTIETYHLPEHRDDENESG